ncbi:hypothetical protein [Caldisericum sp.]|uniref:hypothetical protein n=1 Tax=Caldisericum sp. TaxID=2499687 RepID=UPI003D100D44
MDVSTTSPVKNDAVNNAVIGFVNVWDLLAKGNVKSNAYVSITPSKLARTNCKRVSFIFFIFFSV